MNKNRYHDVVQVQALTDIISNEEKKIFEFVNFMTICGLAAIFGIIANSINIIVFCKQGFNNTVNIAFLGLAISDLCCLISLLGASVLINPLLPVYDTTWISSEVMYLSAAWPHAGFCRITSYITVYITAERFLSIALPLKVKQIVTAKRTSVIICVIFVINLATLIPEYSTSYLDWRFVPGKNKTLIGIIYTESRSDVEGLCHVLHALLSTASFMAVIMFTCALVLQLRKSSQWRKEVTSENLQKQVSASQKERRTVKMVVLIACVLIICYIPGAVIAMVTFVIGSEFNVMGTYTNICEAVWSIAFCFQSLNSSVNIFLYYRMSSKYRQTFNNIFRIL